MVQIQDIQPISKPSSTRILEESLNVSTDIFVYDESTQRLVESNLDLNKILDILSVFGFFETNTTSAVEYITSIINNGLGTNLTVAVCVIGGVLITPICALIRNRLRRPFSQVLPRDNRRKSSSVVYHDTSIECRNPNDNNTAEREFRRKCSRIEVLDVVDCALGNARLDIVERYFDDSQVEPGNSCKKPSRRKSSWISKFGSWKSLLHMSTNPGCVSQTDAPTDDGEELPRQRRRASSVFRALRTHVVGPVSPRRNADGDCCVFADVTLDSDTGMTEEEEALMQEILVRRRSSIMGLPSESQKASSLCALYSTSREEEMLMQEILETRRKSSTSNQSALMLRGLNDQIEHGSPGDQGLWSAEEELLMQKIIDTRRRSSVAASGADSLYPATKSWYDDAAARLSEYSGWSGNNRADRDGCKALGLPDEHFVVAAEIVGGASSTDCQPSPEYFQPACIRRRSSLRLMQRSGAALRVSLRNRLECVEGVTETDENSKASLNKSPIKMPQYNRLKTGRRMSQLRQPTVATDSGCAGDSAPSPVKKHSTFASQLLPEEELLMQEIIQARRRSSIVAAALLQEICPSSPHSAVKCSHQGNCEQSDAAAVGDGDSKVDEINSTNETARIEAGGIQARMSAMLNSALRTLGFDDPNNGAQDQCSELYQQENNSSLEQPAVQDHQRPAAALFRKVLPVLAAQRLAAPVVNQAKQDKPKPEALTKSKAGVAVRAWHM